MNLFNRKIKEILHLEKSLAITTQVGCVNNCSYCPQSVFTKAYNKTSGSRIMSLDVFKKCLETVPKSVIISFAGFSEPFQNKDCVKMIQYAYKKGFKIRVNSSLIGLSTDDINKLEEMNFVKFVIHLPDDHNATQMKVSDEYLAVIEGVILSKIKNVKWKFHRTASVKDIHEKVQELLIKNKIKVDLFDLNSRAGNLDNDKPKISKKEEPLKKCLDFDHNILLPNGDLYLCHMDWGLKHKLGNLIDSSYKTIKEGKKIKTLINSLTEPEFDLLCRKCEKMRAK